MLATLYHTLMTIRQNHWVLGIIWSFSKSASDYDSAFWICVWIIIHKFSLDNNQFTKANTRLLLPLKVGPSRLRKFFAKLTFYADLFEKTPSFVCLVFKIENKWILKENKWILKLQSLSF